MKIDITALRQKLDLLHITNKSIARAEQSIKDLPPEPQRPQWIEQGDELDQYEQTIRSRDGRLQALQMDIQSLKRDRSRIFEELKQAIPANTWVYVPSAIVGSKPISGEWIGYHTDDWPGYVPYLRIEKEKPEQPLTHHHTRG